MSWAAEPGIRTVVRCTRTAGSELSIRYSSRTCSACAHAFAIRDQRRSQKICPNPGVLPCDSWHFCSLALSATSERGVGLLLRQHQRDFESVIHVDRFTLKRRRTVPTPFERVYHRAVHERHAFENSAVVNNTLHGHDALHHHLALDF